MAAKRSYAAAGNALVKYALGKPEATEHHPWGETAIKVKGKVFLFLYRDAKRLSLSTKLPGSSGVALLPFAQPTGYGLGKAGWVSAAFEDVAVAPKKLSAALTRSSPTAADPARPSRSGARGRRTRPPKRRR
jgi:predicted DNA-binding protein (MmcQ/YjbR family)